jgi:hypothetical protein
VIEPALGAALMASVGLPTGSPSGLTSARVAAVDLATVTAAAKEEDLPAKAATYLAQGLLAVRHNAGPGRTRDSLDAGTRSCQTGVTSFGKADVRGSGGPTREPGPHLLSRSRGTYITWQKTRREATG